MPNDSSFYKTISLEPQFIFTGCICPNVKQGHGIHEVGCPTRPVIVKKPTPYAGRRVWKRYWRMQS